MPSLPDRETRLRGQQVLEGLLAEAEPVADFGGLVLGAAEPACPATVSSPSAMTRTYST